MGAVVQGMPENNVWMFENGTLATKQIGYFDSGTDSWYLRTDDKQYEDTDLSTIVRGCANNNQLTEVFFKAQIKKNTRPAFVSDFDTQITLKNYTDHQTIELPKIKDAEGHDYEIFITRQHKQDSKTEFKAFPSFMFFDK